MKRTVDKQSQADELRRCTEGRFHEEEADETVRTDTMLDPLRMLHELQVHQIELETQNEELRRVRDELEASLVRYSDLYDFAPVGYLTLEENSAIREINLAGAAMLGRERSRLIQSRFAAYLTPETRPAFQAFLQALLDGGAKESCELILARDNNKASHVHLEGVAAGSSLRPGRLCRIIAMDVTERRGLEERLRHAQKAEAIALLAAGVAHDINNPLTYVIEGLHHVGEELLVALPGRLDLHETVKNARDGAERIRDVARTLKVFSRPGPQTRTLVDAGEELESALRLASNEIRHRARLFKRLDSMPRVMAEPHQLGQVFLNLLVNAVQAIPEGNVDAHEIAVTTYADAAGWAVVMVRDTGVGIPPSVLPRVFDPFFTTKPWGTGTGIGLALAHGIVSAAGGRIEVESQIGKGSTFTVRLPPATGAQLVSASEVVAEPPIALQSPGADVVSATRLRVLVVDDDPLVVGSIVRVLKMLHEVTVASSGAEAFAQIDSGAVFDVVLCDIMMPEMTGMELFERVEKRWPELARRFVFLTGGAFSDGTVAFLNRSTNPRLDKPFNPVALRDVVLKAADPGKA